MRIGGTKRLYMRRFREEDWKDFHEYFSDPEVLAYEPYEPFSEETCKEVCLKRSTSEDFYAVCLKEDDKLIGNLYVHCSDEAFDTWEIGYVFNKHFHGRGYGSESVDGILAYLFTEKKAHRVIAMCDPLNTPSWKLLERVGMKREAHFKKEIYFKRDAKGQPIWKDTYVYAILDEAYSVTHKE